VMVSPLNNVFTFKNAHTCLQCAAYQERGSSNLPRQMTRAFRTHKPTAKESLECVIRETPGILEISSVHSKIELYKINLKSYFSNNLILLFNR
jgi:hypothetical protein